MTEEASDRRKIILEVLNVLRGIEQRYHYHAQTMDALYAKDAINGSIQAIQTAYRAVEKMA